MPFTFSGFFSSLYIGLLVHSIINTHIYTYTHTQTDTHTISHESKFWMEICFHCHLPLQFINPLSWGGVGWDSMTTATPKIKSLEYLWIHQSYPHIMQSDTQWLLIFSLDLKVLLVLCATRKLHTQTTWYMKHPLFLCESTKSKYISVLLFSLLTQTVTYENSVLA